MVRWATGLGARAGRVSVVLAIAVTIAALAAVPSGATAAGKKKVSPCGLLTTDQITDVLGQPVTQSGEGTLALSCGYDVGPGLGEPGGGIVVIQLHTGAAAKAIWQAAKSGDKRGKFYWDPTAEIASGWKKKKMVAASVSYTGGPAAPEAPLVEDQSLALLALALKRV